MKESNNPKNCPISENRRKKKYYILTYGCQMNIYDSHLMSLLLEKSGYQKTNAIEKSDIIIINTCSVRDHAVNRALSRINSLKYLKIKNPHLRIGVTGCIPQQMKDTLKEELPFIDFVLGPDNLLSIPSCAEDENGILTEFSEQVIYSNNLPARGSYPEAFVAVMRGCNNFCSYCVVPYTRGKEKSRRFEDILHEVQLLSEKGYKRVTLLGQNVNNYNDKGKKLPQLLTAVAQIKSIERINFLTSHPAFFPLLVIEVMKDEPKIEKYIHLPLQSGSSRILKLMNRNYSSSEYLNIIEKIRGEINDIALSTDIIVGFPGENEDDFRKTIDIVKKIGFDSSYMFKYSTRKNTLANAYHNDIKEEIKLKRLSELIKIQSFITKQKSLSYIGKEFEVLITGTNRKNCLESVGISVYNKRVVVKGNFEKGDKIKVLIDEVNGWTPIGTPLLETEVKQKQ